MGTQNICCSEQFRAEMEEYLCGRGEEIATMELMTLAACTGHSFSITRSIPEGARCDACRQAMVTRSNDARSNANSAEAVLKLQDTVVWCEI